ncbi:oxidoreductase [Gandjariella thermophila]|uniref:Oxidoreductase n=1 Tax=Gandjariella thermophila TaxID=1931992 RepID=A0A4D4J8N3_9PSEU|nr:oxidoreductase [Gandjariella thermophila]
MRLRRGEPAREGVVAVANMPWEGRTTTESMSAEARLEAFLSGAATSGDGPRLDVTDRSPGRSFELPAEQLTRRLMAWTDPGLGRLTFWRRTSRPPVIRIRDTFVTGTFALRAVEFGYLLEFLRCRFEDAPDLRQTRVAGLEFKECWLPGLHARNLRSDSDVLLMSSTVEGRSADLTDADIRGSLLLRNSTLINPNHWALHADRLVLAGALMATNLHTHGEVRMIDLRAHGDVDFRGARLINPNGFAIHANGMQVGGNLLCTDQLAPGQATSTGPAARAATAGGSGERRPFLARGTISLANARISSGVTMRGASLTPTRPGALPLRGSDAADPHVDRRTALNMDRIEVDGSVRLDDGFRSTGTLRMVNGRIGGSLWLARADVDASGGAPTPSEHRSLHVDGTTIDGDIYGQGVRLTGEARLVNTRVKGNVVLDESVLRNGGGNALLANWCHIGSNLSCRQLDAEGTVELRTSDIGANLNLRAARLARPGSYRYTTGVKPVLDVGGARIGRDLICAAGEVVDAATGRAETRDFHAHGGVRVRHATVGREVNLRGARLGDDSPNYALNALGLATQELRLNLRAAPRGPVTLRQARCTVLDDNAAFWDVRSGLELDDFRYEALAEPVGLDDDDRIRQRLDWLRSAMRKSYRPGPYDQFAVVLRATGNDEHASTVLIEKQRLRHAALADGSHGLVKPLVLLWSWLQRWMVGYGYRPARALAWLVVLLLLGGLWFTFHPLQVINEQDHLEWNPWLYTIDLLVPIIDLGNKNRWHVTDASQWISSGLIAMGWVLATTVAAGVTRTLKRT